MQEEAIDVDGPSVSASADQSQTRYLSIREATWYLKVSERSVYGYLETGKLVGCRVDGLWMVEEAAVLGFVRKAPGRVRVLTPKWRKAPVGNVSYLTMMRVRVCAGQEKAFEAWCEEIRQKRRHLFVGTAARYVMRDQADPGIVVIVLVWREVVMPAVEEREQVLEALRADIREMVVWEEAEVCEGQVLVHA